MHPADLGQIRTAAERGRLGDLVESRAAELAALIAPEFHRMLRRHGVDLVPFAAIPLAAAHRPTPVLRHA